MNNWRCSFAHPLFVKWQNKKRFNKSNQRRDIERNGAPKTAQKELMPFSCCCSISFPFHFHLDSVLGNVTRFLFGSCSPPRHRLAGSLPFCFLFLLRACLSVVMKLRGQQYSKIEKEERNGRKWEASRDSNKNGRWEMRERVSDVVHVEGIERST